MAMILKIKKMAFKNPWGKGSDQFEKWFSNTWNAADDGGGKAFANALGKQVQDPNAVPEKVERRPNPAGKTSSPQLIAFDWKGTAEKLNNPINWEMGSGEWVGEGPEPFEKGPLVTTKTTYITELVFPSAESINKWNDQLDETKTKLADVGGVEVGIATVRLAAWLGIAIGYAASRIFDKLLTPMDVNLNPGDKVVTTSVFQTIRTTQASGNGVEISSTMAVVGTNPRVLKTTFGFISLDPNNVDEDDQVLKTYENDAAAITIITNPNYFIGRPELRLIRTN